MSGGRYLTPTFTALPWAEDIGMMHVPVGTAKRQSRNGPRGLMIPKGSKNQDQAWDFVRFISSKEGMQLLFRANYSTPARKSLWDAFSKLPARSQSLLRLLFADPQPSYQEIAALTGMPLGSIGPTRARCLQELRERLQAGSRC